MPNISINKNDKIIEQINETNLLGTYINEIKLIKSNDEQKLENKYFITAKIEIKLEDIYKYIRIINSYEKVNSTSIVGLYKRIRE